MAISKCSKYTISSVLWTPEEERWEEKKDQGEKAPFPGLVPLPLACLKRGFSWAGYGFQREKGYLWLWDRCFKWNTFLPVLRACAPLTPPGGPCTRALSPSSLPLAFEPQDVLEELACFIHAVTTLLGEDTFSVPWNLSSYSWRP